jgi:ATP-dependent Zn protease
MMTNSDRRGVAYHEAGHAVAALALGLRVKKIEIEFDGDASPGAISIEPTAKELSSVDRIAICFASEAAAEIFDAPMKSKSYWADRYQAEKLTEGLDEESKSALEQEGYQRAVELLTANREQVVKVAEYLIENCKIDHNSGFELLEL